MHPPPNTPRTMEDVWKDITTLPHHHNQGGTGDSGAFIFQDFFSRDPLPTTSVPSPPHPPPAPPTLLTLNSVNPPPTNHLMNTSSQPHIHRRGHHHVSRAGVMNVGAGYDALVPDHSYDNVAGPGMKRFPDFDRNHSGDRRHKRMIKNRESAARSRSRKQAYTNELELEVAHLVEENARLREQQQELYLAAADAQHQKKKSLQRTLTAPF